MNSTEMSGFHANECCQASEALSSNDGVIHAYFSRKLRKYERKHAKNSEFRRKFKLINTSVVNLNDGHSIYFLVPQIVCVCEWLNLRWNIHLLYPAIVMKKKIGGRMF